MAQRLSTVRVLGGAGAAGTAFKPAAKSKAQAIHSHIVAGTTPCDVQIKGVDKAAPNLLGGMDGLYRVLTCANGRPLYKRDTNDIQGEQPHQCNVLSHSINRSANSSIINMHTKKVVGRSLTGQASCDLVDC